MVRVPVDLTGEQKTVMAIFSIRQFLLIVPAGTISLFQLIMFNWPLVTGWFEIIIRILFVLVVNGITLSLAFINIPKYDLPLSDFLVLLVKFKKSKKFYTN